MKLVFDANQPLDLVRRLAHIHPGSAHVLFVGLAHPPADEAIWRHASSHGFIFVT
jgi:predicted nuclease of predicted toxin-antitoxin system